MSYTRRAVYDMTYDDDDDLLHTHNENVRAVLFTPAEEPYWNKKKNKKTRDRYI